MVVFVAVITAWLIYLFVNQGKTVLFFQIGNDTENTRDEEGGRTHFVPLTWTQELWFLLGRAESETEEMGLRKDLVKTKGKAMLVFVPGKPRCSSSQAEQSIAFLAINWGVRLSRALAGNCSSSGNTVMPDG